MVLDHSSDPWLIADLIQISVQEVESYSVQNDLPRQCWCINLIFYLGIQALVLKEIHQYQVTILSQTAHWKYLEILLKIIIYEEGVSNSSNQCS